MTFAKTVHWSNVIHSRHEHTWIKNPLAMPLEGLAGQDSEQDLLLLAQAEAAFNALRRRCPIPPRVQRLSKPEMTDDDHCHDRPVLAHIRTADPVISGTSRRPGQVNLGSCHGAASGLVTRPLRRHRLQPFPDPRPK
jgi:hypothetical protein